MEIKGLPNYDFVDEDGIIKCFNKRRMRWVSPQKSLSPGYTLRYNKKNKHFSYGFLRFLMLHPEIDAWQISPLESRIKFAEDGAVIELYGGSRKSRYNCFKDVDDALATVIAMKAAASGDMAFIHRFIAESRENAIWTVAGLLKTTAAKVRESLEDGEERFIEQIKTARCERIIPLYAWFCRCIKSAMLKKRNHLSIEGKELDKWFLSVE